MELFVTIQASLDSPTQKIKRIAYGGYYFSGWLDGLKI